MGLDHKEFDEWCEQIRQRTSQAELDEFKEGLLNNLTAMLLTDTIKNTPVSTSYDGHVGGTLWKSWTGGTAVNPKEYASTIPTQKLGDGIAKTISNGEKYAIYVEYGHRQEVGRYVPAIGKRLKKPWVNGKFMLTRAEQQFNRKVNSVVSKKVQRKLKEIMGE